jgi:hypothetical protein
MELNTAQKNHLTVSLLEFEKALRTTQKFLNREWDHGILYSQFLNFDDADYQLVQKIIADALERIQKISDDYELRHYREDLARSIMARMSVCWAGMVDTKSSSLRKFGNLVGSEGTELDDELDRLSQEALILSEYFSRISNPDQPDSSGESKIRNE